MEFSWTSVFRSSESVRRPSNGRRPSPRRRFQKLLEHPLLIGQLLFLGSKLLAERINEFAVSIHYTFGQGRDRTHANFLTGAGCLIVCEQRRAPSRNRSDFRL